MSLLDKVEGIFENEPKLIKISSGEVVFIGDTHGDLDATEKIIEKYLRSGKKLIFLGDYVDRGNYSRENIDILLSLKVKYPERVYLLMGNHEGVDAISFYPADFWESLDSQEFKTYARVLSKLPLAVSTDNGIIALHGALPDITDVEEINFIEFGNHLWQQIVWGDFSESEEEFIGGNLIFGRPTFGQKWFERVMSQIRKNVLIRSHQPTIRDVIFKERCLTLFTSSAYGYYGRERKVAICDLEREIKSVRDLRIETI